MWPLNEFKKNNSLTNVKYLAADDGREKRNVVSAYFKGEMKPWYHREQSETYRFEFVPKEAIELVSKMQNNFTLSLSEDQSLIERAKGLVFPGLIESVIESVPFEIDDEKKMVYFTDMLVVKSMDPHHYGMKVYVDSIQAGRTAIPNLKNMIGQVVPVTILNLNEQQAETFRSSKGIKNNYIANGSIFLAEWLMNHNTFQAFWVNKDKDVGKAKKKLLLQEQEKLKDKTHDGLVTRITTKGVWVLGKSLETVFIRFNQLNYDHFSKVRNKRSSISRGDSVKYKLVDAYRPSESGNSLLDNLALAGKSNINALSAESLSLQSPPVEEIVGLIDGNNMVGKTFNAYVISFDPVKGHLIELEGFPGVMVKLQSHPEVTAKLATTQEEIVVSVVRSRYRREKDGKVKLTVQCRFISKLGHIDTLAGFFDFK